MNCTDTRFAAPKSTRPSDWRDRRLDHAEAADLDRQIAFTDGLIDRGVYRLYGLSEVGTIVAKEWQRSEEMREEVILDAFV